MYENVDALLSVDGRRCGLVSAVLLAVGYLAATPRVVQRVHDLAASDFQHPRDRDAARARNFLLLKPVRACPLFFF